MALKNMIKVNDRVTFGRSGETKRAGRIAKMNAKTAHIKCSNGDVVSVSYGLIQKPSTKKKKAATTRRKTKTTRRAKAPSRKRVESEAAWERRIEAEAEARQAHQSAASAWQSMAGGREPQLGDNIEYSIPTRIMWTADHGRYQLRTTIMNAYWGHGGRIVAVTKVGSGNTITVPKAIPKTVGAKLLASLTRPGAAKRNPGARGRVSPKYRAQVAADSDFPSEETLGFAETDFDEYESAQTRPRAPKRNPAPDVSEFRDLITGFKVGYLEDLKKKIKDPNKKVKNRAEKLRVINQVIREQTRPRAPKRNPYGSFARGGTPAKRSRPVAKTTKYSAWLSEQPKSKLKDLDKALMTLIKGSGGSGTRDLETKQLAVRKELRKR